MSWLLALHSSSPVLGVGLQRLDRPDLPPTLARFDLGRDLANQLLGCIEQVLPAAQWPALGRLAVATGPGGFTGTRLTVVLARTLAQQLALLRQASLATPVRWRVSSSSTAATARR